MNINEIVNTSAVHFLFKLGGGGGLYLKGSYILVSTVLSKLVTIHVSPVSDGRYVPAHA